MKPIKTVSTDEQITQAQLTAGLVDQRRRLGEQITYYRRLRTVLAGALALLCAATLWCLVALLAR